MYNSIPRAHEYSIFASMIPHSSAEIKPVIMAAHFGHISFSMIQPDGQGFLTESGLRPSFTLICDDDGSSLGPQRFHGSRFRKLIAQADHAFMLAYEYDALMYSAACLTASALGQNVVFVETRLQHEAEWISFIETINPNIRFTIATPIGGHA